MFAIGTIENKTDLEAESELGADYLRHMMPVAMELAAQKTVPKRIQHRGEPVTPRNINI